MPTQARTILIWTHHELTAGMRALARTLAPEGFMRVGAARVVNAVQRFLGTELDLARLAPIGDAELAAKLVHPWLRQQLVRALIVGALIDGAPTRAQLERIRSIAAALRVEEPGIRDLELYLQGKRWRLRRHLLARFWAIDHIKERIAQRGFFRTIVPAILATVFKVHRDRALAARFSRLRWLPAGTLGRGFATYLEDNGFSFPGERGAVTDIIVPHDLAHVLGGYGTTPSEEVQVACFSAGQRARDPFAYVLFVLFQFGLGVQMTPGAAPEKGYFDPELAIAAIERGAAMTIDTTAVGWDYWSVIDEPMETLRRRYGIPPRRPATRARAA